MSVKPEKIKTLQDEITKFSAFTTDPPVLICECGKPVEPIKCNLGYPSIQKFGSVCEDCKKLLAKQRLDNKDQEAIKYRLANIRKIAMGRGVPPEKARKVKREDFGEYSITFNGNGQGKKTYADQIAAMIKSGKNFLIYGESDSEKTHLASYLFLKLLKDLPLVPEKEFVWASLLDIHERVIADINNEHYVLNEFRIPKYLFLHFGEYSGELASDDSVTKATQRIMFKITEYRTERKDKIDIYVSTYDIRKMFLLFGNEIAGRIVEKCHEISLPKKGHRLAMFKQRPKIEG